MTGFAFRRSILAAFVWLFAGVALAVAQTNLPNARVGAAYTYQVTTTPAAGPGAIYGATGLPAGISINASSGLVSGTPTTAGSYNGTISLTENGLTDNFSVVLVVDPPLGTPAITSATTLSGTAGTAIGTYSVTASNSPTSFNVGSLPAGLSLGGTTTLPTIFGTPTTAGTYQVSLSANNATGTGATKTLAITIAAAGPVPVITSATTASATPNVAFSYTITASNSPATFSASGLPLGLSVNTTTGAITGTPTAAGVYTVALGATNNNGTSATTNLSLSVGALPAMTSATSASATVATAFNFSLTASNSPFSFNVSGLPPGLSVNASTGAISGTPTTVGAYTVTASANNATGTSTSSTLTINVAAASGGGVPPAVAPVIISLTQSFSVAAGNPASFAVSASGTGTLSYQWRKNTNPISGATSAIYTIAKAQAADAGSYTVTVTNSVGSTTSTAVTLSVTALITGPTFTAQPQSTGVAAGGSVTLTAAATGTGTITYQWLKDGVAIAGATSTSLTLSNVQLTDVASYTLSATDLTGTSSSRAAAVGITSTAKVSGSGTVVGSDIVHPNGNIYDQVLLTGSSATITAEGTKVTRISFIDLNDDIVQVEFSGAGTVALTLENATGPAAPVKYNQPGVLYMKGHASLIVTGANETSNLTVFTVGTATAVNQTLFPAGTTYDGVADIGLISIAATNGKFGGIRAANASFFRTVGLTGISAPGVAVQGPTFIGDITADTDATGVMIFGSTTDVRITGGDLLQATGRAVQVSGITRVNFTAGTKSSGATLPAQANRAQLVQDGADVTTQLVPP